MASMLPGPLTAAGAQLPGTAAPGAGRDRRVPVTGGSPSATQRLPFPFFLPPPSTPEAAGTGRAAASPPAGSGSGRVSALRAHDPPGRGRLGAPLGRGRVARLHGGGGVRAGTLAGGRGRGAEPRIIYARRN